mgnify:FL=1
MSIEADAIRAQVVSEVIQRITALDQEQRYEESYALTQEFREWLLDPRIQPSSRQARP